MRAWFTHALRVAVVAVLASASFVGQAHAGEPDLRKATSAVEHVVLRAPAGDTLAVDAQHFGSLIGQCHGAEGTWTDPRDLDDFVSVEWSHLRSLDENCWLSSRWCPSRIAIL